MERLRLLVGGPKSEWPESLKNGQLAGPWAAADRGALDLVKMGFDPILVVGDFDSIAQNDREMLQDRLLNVVIKTDEIDTDTKWILNLIQTDIKPETLEIYGATGGRMDQLLTNLFMFTEPRFREMATRTKLVDRNNVISFYLPGDYTIVQEPAMKYLGFVALEPVEELNLIDEKYPLLHWTGGPKSFESNEFNGKVNHFSFESGMIAIVQSKDSSVK